MTAILPEPSDWPSLDPDCSCQQQPFSGGVHDHTAMITAGSTDCADPRVGVIEGRCVIEKGYGRT
ncbi:MAG: hypothetical protein JWN03_2242 [Nocardia sp.]|uniref:hypothetical protein n=1 Tax=Nocardia sp. TaxID=1821 RepID=UPI002638DDF4|nr:hypothetical protein [Nocardia sp.]MCU1641967.1 hypothetical protein [Nocardia sp.]